MNSEFSLPLGSDFADGQKIRPASSSGGFLLLYFDWQWGNPPKRPVSPQGELGFRPLFGVVFLDNNRPSCLLSGQQLLPSSKAASRQVPCAVVPCNECAGELSTLSSCMFCPLSCLDTCLSHRHRRFYKKACIHTDLLA